MKKAFFITPPTELWIREDRCQAPIKKYLFSVIRPPIRLAEAAAVLEKAGYECRIIDYPVEEKTWEHFKRDLKQFNPDILFISTVFKTRDADYEACRLAKAQNRNILTIMKGTPRGDDVGALEAYEDLDIFVTREMDFSLEDIVAQKNLDNIQGISFRRNGQVVANPIAPLNRNTDSLPFMARHLLNNKLYTRPDTGKPLATITTAKGCPEKCIFCAATVGMGKTINERSPESIADEIDECVNKHGITDFFFAAETFTYNRKWTLKICDEILSRNLKIKWACTTRADKIDEELAGKMELAGCECIAMGIESGNQESLDRMKKRITLEQIERGVKIVSRTRIKTYLNYIIGLPWETREMVEQTIDFAIKLDGDLTQFILAYPLYGTELFEMAKADGLLVKEDNFLHDYSLKSPHLTTKELRRLYFKAVLRFYFRPRYLIRFIKRTPWNILARTAVIGVFGVLGALSGQRVGEANG